MGEYEGSVGRRAHKPGCERLGKGAGPINNVAPCKMRAGRSKAGSRTRVLADLHVEFIPFSLPGTQPHLLVPGGLRPHHSAHPSKLHADPQVSEHAALGRLVLGLGLARRSPSVPDPPLLHLPIPQAPGPHAGRGGGGAGWLAAPAQKAESRGEGARAVSAVPRAPRRKPAGTQTPERSPSSSPGLPRPRAMEFLWAPLLGLCCSLAAADRHTVFWNSSNPKFRNEDYTVHVRLNDYLDIICPHYEDETVGDAAMEQYTLYLVEHEQYQLCQPQSKDQVRWQCNQPNARHGPEKLSEKFQRFTPFTLGKEFKEGHSYYYISKPIYHQDHRCLRLKVTVNGKITHSPQVHANPQEKRLPADDPEVQVLHSIGHSAAPRLFPLAWAVLLLPLLLLQTP